MSFLQTFAKSVDFASAIRAPFHRDGEQHPQQSAEEDVNELRKLVHSKAFELSDLVSG